MADAMADWAAARMVALMSGYWALWMVELKVVWLMFLVGWWLGLMMVGLKAVSRGRYRPVQLCTQYTTGCRNALICDPRIRN